MLYRLCLPMLLAGALPSVKAADINVLPAPPDPSGWIVSIGGDGRLGGGAATIF
jgi:hypothetical protein